MIYIPSYLNKGSDDEEEVSAVEIKGKKITFWTIITNRRAMMCAVSSIFAMIFMLFMDTILSNYLIDEMKVDENYVGYFFALPCLIYTISCPIVGYATKFVPRLYLNQLAFLICFVGMLMFGPSKVFGFPQNLVLSTVGNCIDGFACALIFVPLLSEIVDAVKEKEGLSEVSDDLNDLAAGFFNTSYAIGCLFAPILGGAFKDWVGFRSTCDIFAFASLGYALIFFVLSVIPHLQKQSKTKS